MLLRNPWQDLKKMQNLIYVPGFFRKGCFPYCKVTHETTLTSELSPNLELSDNWMHQRASVGIHVSMQETTRSPRLFYVRRI